MSQTHAQSSIVYSALMVHPSCQPLAALAKPLPYLSLHYFHWLHRQWCCVACVFRICIVSVLFVSWRGICFGSWQHILLYYFIVVLLWIIICVLNQHGVWCWSVNNLALQSCSTFVPFSGVSRSTSQTRWKPGLVNSRKQHGAQWEFTVVTPFFFNIVTYSIFLSNSVATNLERCPSVAWTETDRICGWDD